MATTRTPYPRAIVEQVDGGYAVEIEIVEEMERDGSCSTYTAERFRLKEQDGFLLKKRLDARFAKYAGIKKREG
jgi:hypothetical protein